VLEIPGHDVIQPSLMLLLDGRVRAFLRDRDHTAIRTALLDPTTATWSAAEKTDLPNPDLGLDAFIDDTGEIVVIHNPSTTNRHALMLSASGDGMHFPRHCNLVPSGTQGNVAYPVGRVRLVG
jgi:predicted neuraminidase